MRNEKSRQDQSFSSHSNARSNGGNDYGGDHGQHSSYGNYQSHEFAGTGSNYNGQAPQPNVNRDSDSQDPYRRGNDAPRSGGLSSGRDSGSNQYGNSNGLYYGQQADGYSGNSEFDGHSPRNRKQQPHASERGYNSGNSDFNNAMLSEGGRSYPSATTSGFNSDTNSQFDNRSQTRTGRFSGVGPKDYKRSDERIQEEVCERLCHDSSIDASNIDVSVKDGLVTLAGSVEDRNTKRMAEACVEELSGVKDVTNNIRVHNTRQNSNGSDSGTSKNSVSSMSQAMHGTKNRSGSNNSMTSAT